MKDWQVLFLLVLLTEVLVQCRGVMNCVLSGCGVRDRIEEKSAKDSAKNIFYGQNEN